MPAQPAVLRTALVTLAGFALTAVLLFVWWPAGVVVGLALGLVVVLAVGAEQQRAARAVAPDPELALALGAVRPAEAATEPAAAEPAPVAPPADPAPEAGVRADLDRLKTELGDDYPDFARAARLVVSTQYASAARLQRDLHLPYSRARRLLADLESEHIVGPATGSLPRQVLLPKERLPEVERLFAGV